MLEKTCKICKEEMFENENCFGDTEDMAKICGSCFEQMKPSERKGIVPVTSIMTDAWKEHCKKFNLIP